MQKKLDLLRETITALHEEHGVNFIAIGDIPTEGGRSISINMDTAGGIPMAVFLLRAGERIIFDKEFKDTPISSEGEMTVKDVKDIIKQ